MRASQLFVVLDQEFEGAQTGHHTPVMIWGPPGVGKTHLAVAIGLEATKQRIRVKFITAEELVIELIAARQSNTLVEYLEAVSRIELLVIDEIGYLDIQKEPFTVVGIGDMAGDVFGNGMLLSKHIQLIGAFNHVHIFVDPKFTSNF